MATGGCSSSSSKMSEASESNDNSQQQLKLFAKVGNDESSGYTCTYDAHTTDATDDSDTASSLTNTDLFIMDVNNSGKNKRSSLKYFNHKQQKHLKHFSQNFNMHHRMQHLKQNNRKKMMSDVCPPPLPLPASIRSSQLGEDASRASSDLMIKSCLVHRNSLTSDEETSAKLSNTQANQIDQNNSCAHSNTIQGK